jgi:transglutaminase-like putative cysteine protease
MMGPTPRAAGLIALVLGFLAVPLAWSGPIAAQDSWDAVYLSGAKVGHIHTFITPLQDRGRDLLRVRVDMVLTLRRLNDRVTIRSRFGTIETPEGEVLRLDNRSLISEQELRVFGDVIDHQMLLTLEGGGQRQQVRIPWGPEVRGPYAAEQSLARSPIQPGQTRRLRMFIPDLNKICDITLAAKPPEQVELGGGAKRALLRVEQTTTSEGKPRPEFNMTYWVDAAGQVLKSFSDNFGGMITYRTTREAAAAPDAAGNLDQIMASIIKVASKIARPEATRDVVYRVSLTGSNPAQVFPGDRRQTVRAGADASTAILEVRTAGPGDGAAGPEQVAAEFLRPNTLVSSDDDRVATLARRAVGDALDPWDRAVRIQHWVAQNLRNKNFETTFAPASEVARNLSGDCTEHGVLTAAMCRAVGVPARVVVGLLYVDHLGGFGFHLWNEVYVNRRWVAIDSTFDQAAVDAVHIKLSDSSLDGVAPFEAFLPVVRVLGKLAIEPREIR